MMERKFTDDEIVKALELCGNRATGCSGCPYFGIGGHEKRNKDILDLINRQKAEIQRLNFENLQMIANIKHLKSEAIKEFAERLLDKYDIWTESDATEYQYVAELTGNLVKEMTGEDSNE